MIKKFLLVSSLLFLFSASSFCLAQDTVSEMQKQLDAAAQDKGAGFGQPVDPRDTIFLIIRSALTLLGIVFVVLTLYAGFLWMTAGGAEENIEKAKGILTAAVIGLAIILLSYSIMLFVFKVILTENRITPQGFPQEGSY